MRRRVFYTVECRECGTVGDTYLCSAARGRDATISRINAFRNVGDDADEHNAFKHEGRQLAKPATWEAVRV